MALYRISLLVSFCFAVRSTQKSWMSCSRNWCCSICWTDDPENSILDAIHSIANGHIFAQFVRSGTFDRKILISVAHLVHCRTFRYVRQKNIDLSCASCALRYVRHKNIEYQCSLICFVVRSLEKTIRWTRWGSSWKPSEPASRTRENQEPSLLFPIKPRCNGPARAQS
jgi:hypothetical protein